MSGTAPKCMKSSLRGAQRLHRLPRTGDRCDPRQPRLNFRRPWPRALRLSRSPFPFPEELFCKFNLSLRHSLNNCGAVRISASFGASAGETQPHICQYIVPRNSPTFGIMHPKLVLCFCISLLGSPAVPLGGLSVVNGHAFTLLEHMTQGRLCRSESLVRSQTEPSE